jgi:hypothetical protein
LTERSRASRTAVRFLAAAADAFFARADRSSGVMVAGEHLLPILPPLRPNFSGFPPIRQGIIWTAAHGKLASK